MSGIGFPQDNILAPTGRIAQSWQRFFQALLSRVGDFTVLPDLGVFPAVTNGLVPGSGGFVSGSATTQYQLINGWVYWQVTIDITDNGTAGISISVPLPISTFSIIVGTGRNLNTGEMLQCTGFVPRPTGRPYVSIAVYKYDGTYPLGAATSGNLELQIVYRVS